MQHWLTVCLYVFFAWCVTLALILLPLALTCMAADTDSSILGEFCCPCLPLSLTPSGSSVFPLCHFESELN